MTIGYAVRYCWPWFAATLIVALLVAGAVEHKNKPTYQATALVQFDASDAVNQGPIDVTSQETRATQIIQLMEGTPLLTRVCREESPKGIPCTAGELASQTSGSLVKSTTMIAITVSAARAAWAASLANAVANATVQQQQRAAQRFYGPAITSRNTEAKQVQAEITSAEQQIAAIPAAQQNQLAAPFISQLDTLQSQYGALTTDLETLQVQLLQDESSVTLAQPAQVPSQPVGPSLHRYLEAGAGAGVVLGCLAMLVAARLDRRVREGRRLAQAAGLPFVFELPRGRSLLKTEEACVPAIAGLLGRKPKVRSVLLVPTDTASEVHSLAGLVGDVLSAFGRDVRVVVEEGLARPAEGRVAVARQPNTVTPVNALEALPQAGQSVPVSGHPEIVVFGTAMSEQSALAMLLAPRVDLVVLVASEPRARMDAVGRAAALLRHAGADIAAGILIHGPGRLPEPPVVLALAAETA